MRRQSLMKLDRMPSVCCAVGLVLLAVGGLRADLPESSDGNPWAAAAQAAGYADALAHQPRYDDQTLWPGTSGRERYIQQQVTGGRTLVWAHPGRSGESPGDRDPWDGANWTDAATGRPIGGKVELDAETDIVLPAAEQQYVVNWRRRGGGEHQTVTVRSITVQPSAGWSSAGAEVHGNLWIKRGGRFSNHGSTSFVGEHDTFFRNDNTSKLGLLERNEETGTSMTQYFGFAKAPGASVEVLGHSRAGDECRIRGGLTIIGPDSFLQPGRNAVPFVDADATLAVMDGGRFGKWCNQVSDVDMELRGTLQGGLPERPLKRDAHFGLSYHNSAKVDFYDQHTGKPTHNMRFHNLNDRKAGMVAYEGAAIRAHAEDPGAATLVIEWFGLDAAEYQVDRTRGASEAEKRHLRDKLALLPKKIAVIFQQNVTVDHVRFDDVLQGGLLLASPDRRAEFEDCYFGDDNAAPREDLFHVLTNYGGGAEY